VAASGRDGRTTTGFSLRAARYAAQAVTALLAVLGALSLSGLRTEFLTADSPPEIRLQWLDPGASARHLEERLALPLESRLPDLPGVADFDFRILDDRLDLRLELTDAKQAPAVVEALHTQLHEASLPPPSSRDVELPGHSTRLAWRVQSSTRSAAELALWSRQQLLPALRGLAVIGTPRLEGEPAREIVVTADDRRLAAVGLTLLDVVRSIQRADAIGRKELSTPLSPGGQPTSPPALAVIPVKLPDGVSVPLSTLAQIRERPVDAGIVPAHFELVFKVRPAAAHEAMQRVESHLAWMKTNGLVPADISITRASVLTDLPTSSIWLAVGGATLLTLMVFATAGAGAGGRWLAAASGAVLAGLGLLAVSQASLNVLTLSAVTLALAPAASMLLLIRWSPVPVSTGLAALTAVTIIVAPGLLLLSDTPAMWTWRDPLRVFVVTGLLACLAVFASEVPRDVRPEWFQRLCAQLVRHLQRVWRRGAWPAVLLALAGSVGLLTLPSENVFAPWSGQAWHLRLHGDNLDHLAKSAGRLMREISGVAGLSLSGHSLAEQNWNWRVTTDPVQLEEKRLEADDAQRLAGLSRHGAVAAVFVEGEQRVPVRVEPALRTDAGPAADISRLIVAGEIKDRPVVLLRDVAQAEPHLEYTEIRRDRRGRYIEIGGAFTDAAMAAAVYDTVTAAASRLAPSGTYEWRGMALRVPDIKRALVMLFAPWLLVAVLSGGLRYRRAGVMPAMLFAVLAPLPGVVLVGLLQGGVSVPLLCAALLSAGVGAAVTLVLVEYQLRAGPGMSLDAVRHAFPGVLALVLPWLAVTLFWFWPNRAGFWLVPFTGGLYAGLFSILIIAPSMRVLAGSGWRRSSGAENGTK
jgi:multidrug efflux pump subunit AcrB